MAEYLHEGFGEGQSRLTIAFALVYGKAALDDAVGLAGECDAKSTPVDLFGAGVEHTPHANYLSNDATASDTLSSHGAAVGNKCVLSPVCAPVLPHHCIPDEEVESIIQKHKHPEKAC